MSTTARKPKRPARPPAMPGRGEALFTRRMIAERLSLSVRTLDQMIVRGDYPAPDCRLPDPERGDPRWRESTHDAWVRRRCGVEQEV